jgi:hypothetical protein
MAEKGPCLRTDIRVLIDQFTFKRIGLSTPWDFPHIEVHNLSAPISEIQGRDRSLLSKSLRSEMRR